MSSSSKDGQNKATFPLGGRLGAEPASAAVTTSSAAVTTTFPDMISLYHPTMIQQMNPRGDPEAGTTAENNVGRAIISAHNDLGPSSNTWFMSPSTQLGFGSEGWLHHAPPCRACGVSADNPFICASC